MGHWRKGGRATQGLALEDFTGGLRAWWSFYDDTVYGTLGDLTVVASDAGVTPPDGAVGMFKASGNDYGGSSQLYDTYIYCQPDNNGQYYLKRALMNEGLYVANTMKCLEFWMYPNQSYGAPIQDDGWNLGSGQLRGDLSLGDFTMGPSQQGGGNKEANGFHTYHGWQACVDTNGRWMKLKTKQGGGFRASSTMPAARCVVTGSSGTFTAQEVINCSPSGKTLIFAFNGSHNSQTCVFGLTTAATANLPSVGDTLTGATSGATRTVSSVTQYYPGTYGEDGPLHSSGFWSGYWADWATKGGMTQEWYSDYPTKTNWDRVTRFYLGTAHNGTMTLPSVNYYGPLTFIDDGRDDSVYCSQIGAFYEPAIEKLYVTFGHNLSYGRTTAEVAYAYSDIHTSGFAAATVIKSLTAYEYGAQTAIYETLAGTAGRDLYIAVRKSDRGDNFMQIRIPTA